MSREIFKKWLSFTLVTLVTVAIVFSVVNFSIRMKNLHSNLNKNTLATASDSYVKGLKDGDYDGKAEGYGGSFKVKISIKNGKLKAINVLENNETPEYYEKVSLIIAQILNQGNANVDSISGATITSEAIKTAVRNALLKAGFKEQIKKIASSSKKDAPNPTKVESGKLKDGKYEASANGYGGVLTVRVIVENGKLQDFKIISHGETPQYLRRASSIIGSILQSQSVNVDSVSNATISSNAIKQAVAKALRKAGSKEKPRITYVKNVKRPKAKLGKKSIAIKTQELKDGIYQGAANGFNGLIKVKVTVLKGLISNVEVILNNDDNPYFNRATQVISKILGKPGKKVDTISGATYSSRGILNAVNNAILKSSTKKNKNIVKAKAQKNSNNPTKNVNPQKNKNKLVNDNKENTEIIENKKLKDGTYIGFGQGFNGLIKVRVTVTNGLIANVEILSHKDDIPYFTKALAVISDLLGKPGKSVDTVSTATYSSRGIISAVNNAISQAGASEQDNLVAKSSNKFSNHNSKTNNELNNPNDSGNSNQHNFHGNSDSGSSAFNKKLKDGTYIGYGQGFNGAMKVKVTITNGLVSGIEVVSHKEDISYFTKAMSVISRLLGKPGKRVDTVSTATYSSNGIINAVNNAISQAIINSENDKPNKTEDNPQIENPIDDKKNPKENPNESSTEEVIDEWLKKYYNEKPLKNGDYTGLGIGYINTRKTKVYIKIENGEITNIRVGSNSEYGDDMGPFRNKAEKVLKLLKGKQGRLNLAKMGLYREYFETTRNSSDPKAKVKELFGEKYLKNLTGYRSDNSESDLTLLSRTVKSYMSEKYNAHELFDSVSGATVSASGISAATREASEKSSNDYKTNTDIKEISIVAPKSKNIEVNENSPVDFSDMQLNIIKKDGSAERVGWKDFDSKDITITDEKGHQISNGSVFEGSKKGKIIKARVLHKPSLSYDEFKISFGNFSKDYIIGLEYSKDGSKWYKVDNVAMDFVDDRNISDHQIINAPLSFEFEKVRIRAVSKQGKKYEYTATLLPVNKKVEYSLVKSDNPNSLQKIYVNFELSGKESEKHIVENDDKKQDDEKPKEEIEVGKEIIDTSLMESNGQQWIERKLIKPATVTSLENKIEILPEIEGLPKGLTFDGKTITGVPQITDEQWPNDGSGIKTITLKFKAKKGDKILVRPITYWVYRDKDRDGMADADEDGGTKFNPLRKDSNPIIVNGKAPSIEEYKAKFSNIPSDGSVQIKFTNKPDYKKKGKQRVNFEFVVDGIKENGQSYLFINVVKEVEGETESIDEKPKEEIEVGKEIIDTSLMESNGQQWIENRPIRPATVTSLDKETTILPQIDGLPKGMTFDGTTISGSPIVEENSWPNDGSGTKTITLKLKAKKGDKILVRPITYWIYRDKDGNGIADSEEGQVNNFTPVRKSFNPIIVDGVAPTIADYKSMFSNIPNDGSVEVTIIREPDFTKKADKLQKVLLQFKVKRTNETIESFVYVKINNPVKKKENKNADMNLENNKERTRNNTPQNSTEQKNNKIPATKLEANSSKAGSKESEKFEKHEKLTEKQEKNSFEGKNLAEKNSRNKENTN